MLFARLNVLACGARGDVRDSGWYGYKLSAEGFDLHERLFQKVKTRAFLGRYLKQPIHTWDDMLTSEIREYVHATNEIVQAESRKQGEDDEVDLS